MIPIFKWYYKWKFRREHKTTAYKVYHKKIDKPLFGPGFLGHLQSPQIWGSKLSKYESPYKRRRFVFFSFVIIVIVAGIWILFESFQAINLF